MGSLKAKSKTWKKFKMTHDKPYLLEVDYHGLKINYKLSIDKTSINPVNMNLNVIEFTVKHIQE